MMIDWVEVWKAILLGIVEGVTEWLPVSSTGHMILVDEFLQLKMSAAFKDMFLVVIQLGAIFAVIALSWSKLVPFTVKGGLALKKETLSMWMRIAVACIPAGIYTVALGDKLDSLFYNYQTVSMMLILFGVLFIVIENIQKGKSPKTVGINAITYRMAILIGIAQLIAAILPGTSRSGATILCGLLLGLSRSAAAEFTFFLAIPTMLGASAMKLLKFGFDFTGTELAVLWAGATTAFLISLAAISFLMGYLKKHDFKVFGWYRIALGCMVFLYFIAA